MRGHCIVSAALAWSGIFGTTVIVTPPPLWLDRKQGFSPKMFVANLTFLGEWNFGLLSKAIVSVVWLMSPISRRLNILLKR